MAAQKPVGQLFRPNSPKRPWQPAIMSFSILATCVCLFQTLRYSIPCATGPRPSLPCAIVQDLDAEVEGLRVA